jgi:hypothetical protein
VGIPVDTNVILLLEQCSSATNDVLHVGSHDFVLAGVEDDEVGSASGVLNATQQLSGAIGIAAIGTVFFSVLATAGIRSALETSLWIDVGLLAVTAALVCLLPRRAREDAAHA